MSENGSIEENVTGNSSENVGGEVSEVQTLTEEAVNEQIKRFIAPLIRQLGELTRLVQGMVTTPHPSHYPRTAVGTTYGTARHQSDSENNGFSSKIAAVNLNSQEKFYENGASAVLRLAAVSAELPS